MTLRFLQAVRRLRAPFAALVILSFVLPPASGAAADAPAVAVKAPPSKADVDQLVRTMQDPVARQKLIDQLELLAGADKSAKTNEEPTLLTLISTELQTLSDEVLTTVRALADVGHIADWAERQVVDPRQRAAWANVLGKLAAALGGGVVAERLAWLALRSPRRLLSARSAADRLLRPPLAAGLWLLDLLPIAVFLAVARGLAAGPWLALAGDPRQAAVLLTMAYALTRVILTLVQAALMPGNESLRSVPLDDETANYLSIWARRLTFAGVWGYSLAQALLLLGLPPSGYDVVLKLVGLVVATMLVILVLQNRQTVAAWIRGPGDLGGGMKGPRRRLAEWWHILGAGYVVAAYGVWALQLKGGFEFIVRASLLTALIIVLARVLSGVLLRLVNRLFAISEELRRRFPHLEVRVNRYLAIMQNVIKVVVAGGALLAIGQAWGANSLAWLGSDLGRHILSSAISITAVLVGALLIWEQASLSIERYLSKTDADGRAVERSSRIRTLLPLLRHMLLVVLIILVVLIVLSELGLNIAPLLAGAGVVGVAIGFGSQKLVQDVITGAFILFEDTIAIGDTVKLDEHAGVVEGMTIRTLRLRDGNGNIHTIPFSNIKTVTNMSRDFGCHVFDVGVSYHEDVDQVIEVIRTLGDELRADPAIGANITEPIEVFGVDKFADHAVVIQGRLKTLPGKQWDVGREFNRRLKKRFDEVGIELPYPTTTLYFGTNKDGQAATAHVQLEPISRLRHQ
jgi:small conductance mechanosensitive channel